MLDKLKSMPKHYWQSIGNIVILQMSEVFILYNVPI